MEFLSSKLNTLDSSNTPSIYSDIHSLNRIREQATNDSRGAIKAAAKEFEAFFMNMMLKSMRQASEVIGDDSFFSSSQEKMFTGMLDEQMSAELSQKGTLGIAELMTQNLLGENQTNNENIKNIYYPGEKLAQQKTKEIKITAQLADNKETSALLTNNQKSAFFEKKVEPKETEVDVTGVSKKSLFENASQFVKELLPMAQKVAQTIGVDPKLLVAQAALETGWGKFIMHNQQGESSNNLFGIKSGAKWTGESVNVNTLEVEKGVFIKVKDDFRMYDSFEKSFSDYVDFLQTNPRYQSALNVVKDAKQFIQSLQQAGYATDPNYANKILKIFNKDMSSL